MEPLEDWICLIWNINYIQSGKEHKLNTKYKNDCIEWEFKDIHIIIGNIQITWRILEKVWDIISMKPSGQDHEAKS